MIIGAASGAFAAYIMNHASVPLLLLSALVGLFAALLPDIDHPQSTAGRFFWPFSWLIAKIFGHRGITHSMVAVAGLCVMLYCAWPSASEENRSYLLAFLFGYVSHILGDFFTPRGIPLFWPIKKNYRLALFRTGSISETIFVVSLLGAATFYAYWGNGYLS